MNADENVVSGKRKTKVIGHMMIMVEERWPKGIYEWKLSGRRRIGRPMRTWVKK